MPRVGGHVHAAAGLDQLRRHHALHDREDVAPRPLQGEVEVRLVEHHADVDAALRPCRAASDRNAGSRLSLRARSARTARRTMPGCCCQARASAVPRARSESIGQTAESGSGDRFVRPHPVPARYPHVDRIARERASSCARQCRIVTDTPAVGWVLAGDEMPESCRSLDVFLVRAWFGVRLVRGSVRGSGCPRTSNQVVVYRSHERRADCSTRSSDARCAAAVKRLATPRAPHDNRARYSASRRIAAMASRETRPRRPRPTPAGRSRRS